MTYSGLSGPAQGFTVPSRYRREYLLSGGSRSQKVTGSAGTPVLFSAGPPANEIWGVRELIVVVVGSNFQSSPGFGYAGSGVPLTNGFLLTAGGVDLLDNEPIQINPDLWPLGFLQFVPSSAFSTEFVNVTIPLNLRLDGDSGDTVEMAVQDDMTVIGGFDDQWASIVGERIG